MWLRQKRSEAISEPKFLRSGSGIGGTTPTPQVQFYSIARELTHMINDSRHRNTLSADGSNESVVNIDVRDEDVHASMLLAKACRDAIRIGRAGVPSLPGM